MGEKEDLEYAACEYFINSLNKDQGSHFEIVNHSDKPDFLIQDRQTGEGFGLEVTHLFCNDEEAKKLLGRGNNLNWDHENIFTLIQKLGREILDKKFAKSIKYNFEKKLSLLVRVACPKYAKSDFEFQEKEFSSFKNNLFDQIWLLFWNSQEQGFTDLYQIQ